MAPADDILANVQSFDGLDTAARVDQVMGMTPDDRDKVGWFLLLDLHQRVGKIENQRTWTNRLTTVASALVGAVAGMLGLPYIPGV